MSEGKNQPKFLAHIKLDPSAKKDKKFEDLSKAIDQKLSEIPNIEDYRLTDTIVEVVMTVIENHYRNRKKNKKLN